MGNLGFTFKGPYGISSPCYDCKDRHPACHSECEKYKEFKGKIEEINERRRKKIKAADDLYEARYGKSKYRRQR